MTRQGSLQGHPPLDSRSALPFRSQTVGKSRGFNGPKSSLQRRPIGALRIPCQCHRTDASLKAALAGTNAKIKPLAKVHFSYAHCLFSLTIADILIDAINFCSFAIGVKERSDPDLHPTDLSISSYDTMLHFHISAPPEILASALH